MAFDFPSSPTVGQQFTPVAGTTYAWNGYAWTLSPNDRGGFTVIPRVITASGTYTPTSGLIFAQVECVGGGGCSGAGNASATEMMAGGGGGGGACARRLLTAAQIGASQVVTIGAGGVWGGVQAGGTTSFGALCSAVGGGPGGDGSAGNIPDGGVGGVGGVGDVVVAGSAGGPGLYVGNTGSGSFGRGGSGGPSGFGGGGGRANNANTGGGSPGNGYGGGAGGSSSYAGAGMAGGSTGAPGICVVTEYVGNQPLAAGSGIATAGAPSAGQIARWTGATAIEGVAPAAAGASKVLLATYNPAGAASVIIPSSIITAAFDNYEIEFDVANAGASGHFALRVSTDGGATYKSTGYLQAGSYTGHNAVVLGFGAPGTGTYILISIGSDTYSSTGYMSAGSVKLFSPAVPANVHSFNIFTSSVSGGVYYIFSGAGAWNAPGAINTLQIFWGAGGNFGANSWIKFYGIR